VSGIAGQGLLDFFVDDHIDLNTTFSSPLDDLVYTPFLVEKGWAAQEQLGREPPVLDIDGLFGVLQTNRHGPHIVAAIDIPFDVIVVALGEVRLKAMGFTNGGPLAISFLLVLLVVSMVSIDQVLELAHLALEMLRFDFDVMELGVSEFLPD
jgi:hypothetical protein